MGGEGWVSDELDCSPFGPNPVGDMAANALLAPCTFRFATAGGLDFEAAITELDFSIETERRMHPMKNKVHVMERGFLLP